MTALLDLRHHHPARRARGAKAVTPPSHIF
jgi:hypothetical protein